MNRLKEHICFKILTVLLVSILIVPSVVKLNHIYAHQKHEICKGSTTTHIHKVDLDCDFHKFQINNHYFFSTNLKKYNPQISHNKISFLTYNFFYNHRQLSFSLRGPPFLV